MDILLGLDPVGHGRHAGPEPGDRLGPARLGAQLEEEKRESRFLSFRLRMVTTLVLFFACVD